MCAFICLLQLVNVIGCIYFLVYDMRLVFIRHYRRWPLYKSQAIVTILDCIVKNSDKKLAAKEDKKDGSSESSSSESSSSVEEGKEPLQAPRSEKKQDDEEQKKIQSHMDAIADAQLEIRKMKEEIAEKEEAKALA